MAYISPETLNQLYPDETSGLTEEALNAAIGAGEEEVNGLLSAKYVVPFEMPLPALLNDIVVACIRYRLNSQGRPYNTDLYKEVLERYKTAINNLEKIVNGTITLTGENIVPTGTNEAVIIADPSRGWSAF